MLVSELTADGFTLSAAGDRLTVSPSSRLSPEQCDAIRKHKAGILHLLADPPAMHPDDAALVGAYLDHVGEDDPEIRRQFTASLGYADAWQWLYAECVRLGVASI
jgi:hypothetical protein